MSDFEVLGYPVVGICKCWLRIKFHGGLRAGSMGTIRGGLLTARKGAILSTRRTAVRCAALIQVSPPKFAKHRLLLSG